MLFLLNNRMKSETGISIDTPDQELSLMLSDYEKQARNRFNSLFLFLDVHDTPAAFEEKYRREIGALTEANSTGMD